jgi:hypothetical protein
VTNVYDFEAHKKALLLAKTNGEAEEHDIDTEIEWAIKELEITKNSLEELSLSQEMHESYKTELVSYLSGMEMAKRLIDGGELQGTDFWSWVEDEDDNEQLEFLFTPDFEIYTDE